MKASETLAHRIRAELGSKEGVSEKRLFGGLAVMLSGHLWLDVVRIMLKSESVRIPMPGQSNNRTLPEPTTSGA